MAVIKNQPDATISTPLKYPPLIADLPGRV